MEDDLSLVPGWGDRPCLGSGVDFFPGRGQNGDLDKAKAVCQTCPPSLKAACLEYAIEHVEPGVWGGTSKRERDRMIGTRGRRRKSA